MTVRARIPALALLLAGACQSISGGGEEDTSERPFDLVIQGNERVAKGTLERAMALDLEGLVSSEFQHSFADDAAYQAQVTYYDLGHPFARVDYDLSTAGERPRLTLTVDEGPRTILDLEALEAVGVQEFSKEELRAFFGGPRTGPLGGGDLLYVADRAKAARAAIEGEYVARGYRESRVEPVEVTFSEDRTRARPIVRVHEGPRTVVGSIDLAPIDWGGSGRAEERSARCRATCRRFETAPGGSGPRPFPPRLPAELRSALAEDLGNFGYPDAEVQVEASFPPPAEGSETVRAQLAVTIDPGPRVRIGEIRLEGNERTRSSFVHSRLQLDEGDVWSNDKARESVRRLYATGLFHRVSVELDESDERVRDVVVLVEEAPSKEYFIEPGYGSYELLRLRAGMRDKSFLGSGRRLRADTTWAVRALRAEIGLTDPWLFRTDLIGDVSLTFEQRENPSFTSEEAGTGAFVTHEWDLSGKAATTFGYQYRRSLAKDIEIVDEEVTEQAERLDISSFRLSHRWDRRNNAMLPSSGTFLEGTIEWGDETIGSELDFLRFNYFLSGYQPLSEQLLLVAAFRGGVIAPIGEDDSIPLQERYFNGGENTVRSFQESELGPKDEDGNPTGGEAFSVLSLELRHRLGTSRFELAAFADAGTLLEDASDVGDFEDPSYALGVGVRYILPIGPLRLDVAANPDPGEDEEDVVAHFAIGISF